ncbi:peptidoglycan-recognition protein LF-like [Aricia agestis]|uniref:peptidoglycan-recognition protein LF-like n=1 Tax=Aricia agestis TaxID=91739 RepID=UPI001C20341E|nr:peptidoglycan-recognition protein LF-like [Aricia agestis]
MATKDVVLSAQGPLAPQAQMPSVANLNINKSSRVQIGPKFVTVTQNVQNAEMVKGKCLCFDLISGHSYGGLRCAVAVFVCWSLIVATGLSVYFIYIVLPSQRTRLDLGVQADWYLRRQDWQAMPAYDVEYLNTPVPYAILGHSGLKYCDNKYDCINEMLYIQRDNLRRELGDIGPNFLIAGNGDLFEGRGANVVPAMVSSWNRKSIAIMLLGDYRTEIPKAIQFERIDFLLKTLVEKGALKEDYVLYGHCQVKTHFVSPGLNVVKELRRFSHWKDDNYTTCLTLPLPKYLWNVVKNSSRTERVSCVVALVAVVICVTLIVYFTTRPENTDDTVDMPPHEWNITRQMWLAQPYNNSERTTHFDPLFIVIVQHSVSNECRRFVSCAAELRNLQSYFIDTKQYDIPYNFLIGNDGRVYEGRGWGVVGAHTFTYNRCSLGLGFIGDYREEINPFTRVTEAQLNRTHMLLEDGVRLGFLRPDYQIVGAKDLQVTASPGSNLYNALRQWPNYDHQKRFRGLSCEQIYEKYKNEHL